MTATGAGGGVGGGVGTLPTVNEPRIVPECGSQTNAVRAVLKVTFHVTLPVHADSVARSTPGPVRWKLCSSDRSLTSISYAPGSSFVTRVPCASVSEIVKPGPTVAEELRRLRRRRRTACGAERATAAASAVTSDGESAHLFLSTRRAARSDWLTRASSAPKRSASAATIVARASVASSSVSVRSGDWNARWIATDLRPAPTWSPR